MTAVGLIGYGAYIPSARLLRTEIADVLGEGGGKGSRAVASYDEDPVSMGVEAARHALRGRPASVLPERVYFATAAPPYLDRTNAGVIHAALGLDRRALAVDMGGAPRSAVGAVLAAAEASVPTLAVLADLRHGLPGGAEERDGGDGAAALLFGRATADAPVLAAVEAVTSTTEEFLDRWRTPGSAVSRVWEERFGEQLYGPLAGDAFADALKAAGVTANDVDHLVVAGLATRGVRQFARQSGVRLEVVADDLTSVIGNCGTAQPGVVLADVLDRAEPGALIALTVLADGASVFLLRTTDALPRHRSRPAVAAQIAAGSPGLRYATFLSWRGELRREGPRRPDPDPPAAPPAHRSRRYKYGFCGTRCDACGMVHLPPARVCASCRTCDRMSDVPMADVPATVTTYTVDHLAYTPSPPMVAAVVDFDGGGRFRCELTDVDPTGLAVGHRVTMTFRRMVTADGVHNYFWKARPLFAAQPVAETGRS